MKLLALVLLVIYVSNNANAKAFNAVEAVDSVIKPITFGLIVPSSIATKIRDFFNSIISGSSSIITNIINKFFDFIGVKMPADEDHQESGEDDNSSHEAKTADNGKAKAAAKTA